MKKKKGMGILSWLILILCLVIAGFSAWKLWGYYQKYHNGEKEICTLEAIHVAPINNVKTMKPDESMCSSYKYEQ